MEFEDWPEFYEIYEQGGFTGLVIPWDADTEEQAANLGKFRPNAANPTGLYLPLHGGQFFRNWALGQSEGAGAWGRDEIRNITGGFVARQEGAAQQDGAITGTLYPGDTYLGSGPGGRLKYKFNASRVVPTGPVNVPQHIWQPVVIYLGRPK